MKAPMYLSTVEARYNSGRLMGRTANGRQTHPGACNIPPPCQYRGSGFRMTQVGGTGSVGVGMQIFQIGNHRGFAAVYYRCKAPWPPLPINQRQPGDDNV